MGFTDPAPSPRSAGRGSQPTLPPPSPAQSQWCTGSRRTAASHRCNAPYRVAGRPADNKPATAPANAGRVGAPWRSAIKAAARIGRDIAGIAVMHPGIAADQARTPRQPLRHQAIGNNAEPKQHDRKRQQPAPAPDRRSRPRQARADREGWNGERQGHHELEIEKRIVRIAVATSGRTCSVIMNIMEEIAPATINPTASHMPTDRDRQSLSAASVG